MKAKPGSVLTGSLLITGTSIGAGMLALPFATGVAGFFPALVVSALSWLYMLFTGLLFLEVTLWMPDGANLLTMAKRFLGPVGFIVAGAAFIYLYYSLLVAYFSGGVPVLIEITKSLFGWELSASAGHLLFALIFGLIVFLGQVVTGRINAILVIGMIVSYISLVALGSTKLHATYFGATDWRLAWAAAPTLFSAYGYHNVIPSLSMYLQRHVAKLRWAIIVGTSIPFVVYTIWQALMIGALPQEALAETLAEGAPVAISLEQLFQNRWIANAVRYFSLFAITTSVLGVALSMVDFFGDGLRLSRKGWNRLLLVLIVFIPPLFLAWLIPGLFFKALHYAGGFGEAVLNGLLPALMVWVGRYRDRLTPAFRLPLGRATLSLILAIGLAIVIAEALQLAGLLG